jgi:hypothetical protein
LDIKEAGLIGGDIRNHWYYSAKLSALRQLIGDTGPVEVLDVGAGEGFFAEALLRETAVTSAVCVDPGYPREFDKVVNGKPLSFRRSVENSTAGLVLMMDVLEHVPDDRGLVAEYAGGALPGTHFIVSVPAYMWLWSDHDVFLEHYRRYTLPEIEAAIVGGGLTIERGCYFYGALLPLVAGSRLGMRAARRIRGKSEDEALKSQMRAFSPVTNWVFRAVCAAELPLFPYNRLGGLTAFVRARRD